MTMTMTMKWIYEAHSMCNVLWKQFEIMQNRIIYYIYNEVCHRRTNKENVFSADVGPSETNIIKRSKCNMSSYIIIGDYIIKIEILFS